jgi:hypothetical protein
MNRRTAMLLTMLMGGILPRGVFAQSAGKRTSSTGRARGTTLEPAKNHRSAADEPEKGAAGDADSEDPPPALAAEPGQQWQQFDISRYTGLDHSQGNPQSAILEWIFRRTGTAPWHGDKIAVLSASRSKIRVYNDAKNLEAVSQVVERFTNAQSDFLSVRVRFVAAVDTRWRYAVYSRLTPVGSGPQGQQIWTLKVEDSAFVLAQMQVYQGFRLLADQKVDMVNGQTLTVKTSEPRGYTGGIQRESAVGLGYQPKAEQLEEGVTLKLSPLLNFDGDALDAAIDLTANTVKSLHRTKVIAPRDIGPNEMTLDVPEVTDSRLNQTVKEWPLGQTLLISGGIQPGILQNKGGFMNMRIPGTVPSGTELLVFLDAEAAARPRRAAARDRDRDRD